ncbi:MAG: GntR family transcriptional regulator [Bacillota bacterium]
MRLALSPANPTPLYRQIVDQIKTEILTGGLGPGEALPSIRQLAEELLVSVITTRRAYEELEAEGLIVVRQGRGAFVAELGAEDRLRLKRAAVRDLLRQAVALGRSFGLREDEIMGLCAEVLKEEKTDGDTGVGPPRGV